VLIPKQSAGWDVSYVDRWSKSEDLCWNR
jgi:hypothetical protein